MDINQILNKIGKKNLIIIAIAVVSLIFYCFASFMTVSVDAPAQMGGSNSEGMGLLADLFFEDDFILITLVGIVTILAAIAVIVTLIRGMKKEGLYCTFAVAGAGILSIICAMIKGGSLEDQITGAMGTAGAAMFNSIKYNVGAGWGLWIAAIGFAACAAVAYFLPEENGEVVISNNQQQY